jgi:hypothetical protein
LLNRIIQIVLGMGFLLIGHKENRVSDTGTMNKVILKMCWDRGAVPLDLLMRQLHIFHLF